MVHKLASEKMGCLRTLFSHNGLLLACACLQNDQKCIIKIYEMEEGTVVFILRGHKDIIHSLEFTRDDTYLLSAGADYQVKLWAIPNSVNEYIEEEDSEKVSLTNVITHPSYVYQASFIPESQL